MSKCKSDNRFYDAYKSIRRDWGEINPSTKVFENKKHKAERKRKHKQRYDENYEECL